MSDGTLLAQAGGELPAELASALARRLGHPVLATSDLAAGVRHLVGQGAQRLVIQPLALALGATPEVGPAVRLFSQRWPFLAFHLARTPSWLDWAALLPAGGVLTTRPSHDRLHDSELARLAWLTGARPDFEQGSARWPEDAFHAGLVELLARLREEALQDDSLLRPSWTEVALRVAARPEDEEAELRELDRRINELLPPQYQGRYEEVPASSMGSRGLLVGPDGLVAWDQMWTSFCDLAVAGGPSHRGKLLEPITPEEARAEPERYARVVAEIERGIQLVTGLPRVTSAVPGWVGVACDDEAMAIWMLRAILVENVFARREGEVLYLPAGPAFRLEKEIKNVVTVVAKTHHYWSSHRTVKR